MRKALGCALLLLVSTVWAQPRCTYTEAANEARAECDGEGVGIRTDARGRRHLLKHKRSLASFGLKRWHVEKELREDEFPLELPPLADTTTGTATGTTTTDAISGAPVHDYAIFWTPRAEAAQGGAAAMRALVVLAMGINNSAHKNSAIALADRLLVAERVPYTEGDIRTDYTRAVLSADGHLDAIHARASAAGADIVGVIGDGWAGRGYCGLGWLNASSPTLAVFLVDRTCVTGRASFTHEAGHVKGAHHDPTNACGASTCPGYGYGHIFPIDGIWKGDVMAYVSSRLWLFSSPTNTHKGVLTGTPTRDNARAIRDSAVRIAGFRTATVAPIWAPAVPAPAPTPIPTPSPTPTPAPTPVAVDLSCWNDFTVRDLPLKLAGNVKTVEQGLTQCRATGKTYCGIQEGGRMVFAGDTYGKYGRPAANAGCVSLGLRWINRIYRVK